MAANKTNTTPNPNEDDLRADLQAMLAASRELGPDMDRSLVDSYLERQRGAISGGTRAVAPNQRPSGQPQPFGQLANLAGMGMLTAAYVAALIVSGGHLWWLIFVLMGVCGGWWGWWGHDGDDDEERHERHIQRRLAHDDYRLRRHEMRHEFRARRRGYYLPDEDTRREDDRRRDDEQRDPSRDRQASTPRDSYD